MLDKILSTARDIGIISPAEEKEKFVFAFPFEGEVAKHYFDKTISDKRDETSGINRHWNYNSQTGLITGSSTFLALRLDEAARQDGLWIPTLEEARFLDKNGKLTRGVYRDYGMVVYSADNPNQRIAEEIIAQAGSRELPLILPFKVLVHRIDRSFPEGIALSLVNDTKEIKSGEEARKILASLDYRVNSGVSRLFLYWDLDVDFRSVILANSNGVGRVDWMCAEGTRADLASAHEKLLERKYDSEIKKLKDDRDKKQEDFLQSLII